MARHKNENWNLSKADNNNVVNSATVTNALLMDIRDELQNIGRQLSAGRWQERAAEDAVRRIDKRLAKRIKLK